MDDDYSEPYCDLGESLQRYWSRRITLIARNLGADKSNSNRTISQSPGSFLQRFAENCGLLPVLETAIELSHCPGFDPVSSALDKSPNMNAFSARYREIVLRQFQTYVRSQNADLQPDICLDRFIDLEKRSLFVNPGAFHMTQKFDVLPTIFIGAIIGRLRSFRLQNMQCRQLTTGECSRSIFRDNTIVTTQIDANAPWVMTWQAETDSPRQPAMYTRIYVHKFSHLLACRPSRDSMRVAQELTGVIVPFQSFPEMAKNLGISGRTLSRRLANDGTTYKMLVRHSRFHAACNLVAEGAHNLDDVAFSSGYVDRQYMTREFHRLAGMPPAAYRDVVNHY